MTTHLELGTPAPNREANGEVVTLSSTAIARVRILLEREGRPPTAGLRLSVSDGGCSGLRYVMALENEPQPDDVRYDVDGVHVFVAGPSVAYLSGMQLDFVDGLHGAGFKFLNPNADRTCGCGTSFSV